jgi:two-component system phosphate regulon sensor histidine kinase PhoR
MSTERLIKSPQVVASIISVLAALVTGVVAAAIFGFATEQQILSCVAIAMATLASTFIVSIILISLFSARKIKPLYKILYQVDAKNSELANEIQENNLLENINANLVDWTTSKTEEIDRLKEMERYRKEFLGNVSHELKTPIFNIQGYVLTLLDGGLDDPHINRKYLERTEKSINRMIGIVEDLEIITKLEAGELKLNMERFNIVGMVEDIFEALEERARKKQISLELDKLYERPVWVYADKKRIYQVLHNLIINSINYGVQQGHTVVAFSDSGKRVTTWVTDDGIGISQKDIPRIFERFYRVDKSRSREQGGTGLGLAIVKHIIEGHKQSIKVESSLNKGTTFSFTLDKPTKQ